jgi:hypothetical protein
LIPDHRALATVHHDRRCSRPHGFHLTLHVERYERAEDTTGSDANWLVGTVELKVGTTGAFTAKHQVSLFTPDLERFRDELRVLDRDLSGKATLHHVEGQLELVIELANGSSALRGFVREQVGATVSFDQIATDQTYVREALEQFNALMTAFPVRGNPAG